MNLHSLPHSNLPDCVHHTSKTRQNGNPPPNGVLHPGPALRRSPLQFLNGGQRLVGGLLDGFQLDPTFFPTGLTPILILFQPFDAPFVVTQFGQFIVDLGDLGFQPGQCLAQLFHGQTDPVYLLSCVGECPTRFCVRHFAARHAFHLNPRKAPPRRAGR